MLFYFRHEKARVERKRIADASKGMGRPKVGGKFELVDQDGKVFDSDVGMKGRFSIVGLIPLRGDLLGDDGDERKK